MYLNFSRCFTLNLSRIGYLYLAGLSVLATRPYESFISITCMGSGIVSSYFPSKAVTLQEWNQLKVTHRNCSYKTET